MSVPTTVGGLIRRLSGSRQLSAASSAAGRVADSWRQGHRLPVSKNPFVGWLAGRKYSFPLETVTKNW